MAEAKKSENTEQEQPQKKGKKGLIIIVAAVALIVIIGAAAAFFLMKGKPAADEGDEEGDETPVKVEKAKKAKSHSDAPPVFVKLDPFTVKLQTEQQEAYLQVTPELRVLEAHLGDTIKQYNPEIRHTVTLILMGKKASDISTPLGVQQLANEMRAAINNIIDPPPPRKKGKEPEAASDHAGPDDAVQSVLFTSFIIQ